jgi:hypothetical protein
MVLIDSSFEWKRPCNQCFRGAIAILPEGWTLQLTLIAYWKIGKGTTTSSIESLMKTDQEQENVIQTRNYAARVKHVIDRDFDRLRGRVLERSTRALQRQQVQEIAMTVMAIVLGSVTGWAVMR